MYDFASFSFTYFQELKSQSLALGFEGGQYKIKRLCTSTFLPAVWLFLNIQILLLTNYAVQWLLRRGLGQERNQFLSK